MPAGLRVWDEAGSLILDTNDRIVGGLVLFSTGTTNGSHTMLPDAGQTSVFVYQLSSFWFPSSNRRSPWPSFTQSGHTLSWAFDTLVPQAERMTVECMGMTY